MPRTSPAVAGWLFGAAIVLPAYNGGSQKRRRVTTTGGSSQGVAAEPELAETFIGPSR